MKNQKEIRKYYSQKNTNLFCDFPGKHGRSNMLKNKLISSSVIIGGF
jgi:hypothetical protein